MPHLNLDEEACPSCNAPPTLPLVTVIGSQVKLEFIACCAWMKKQLVRLRLNVASQKP